MARWRARARRASRSDVPTIRFAATGARAALTAEAPEGGALVDVCDEARAPVELSCRSASCATCLVEVGEGSELFEPPGSDERDLLARLASPPSQRLACRAVLRAGSGLVRLRWLAER
jgi:ferredoxin